MDDLWGTDLKLGLTPGGQVDLQSDGQDLETVGGVDNLVQALAMRILVRRGELGQIGHPRYGCRVRDLIGAPMDGANLELLRRYIRLALLDDHRVDQVVRVTVRPLAESPGSVEVTATVAPVSGEEINIGVMLDVG